MVSYKVTSWSSQHLRRVLILVVVEDGCALTVHRSSLRAIATLGSLLYLWVTKLVRRAARHDENHDSCQKRIYFIYNLHLLPPPLSVFLSMTWGSIRCSEDGKLSAPVLSIWEHVVSMASDRHDIAGIWLAVNRTLDLARSAARVMIWSVEAAVRWWVDSPRSVNFLPSDVSSVAEHIQVWLLDSLGNMMIGFGPRVRCTAG